MKKLSALFVLVFAFCGTRLAAQPLNFMVGSHVFNRPEAWQWKSLPDQAKVSAELAIVDKDNGTSANIVFLESKATGGWASADETIERWKKNYIESVDKQNLQREEHKFGKVRVTFLWQEGTYRTALASGRARLDGDFAQYGVIIEDGKNNVLARILGNRDVVAKARRDFRKMIEAAFAETE